jgi:hypothetical protein
MTPRRIPMASEPSVRTVIPALEVPTAMAARPRKPVSKVAASGAAGAAVSVLVWILRQVMAVEIPPDIAAALITLLMFAVGYAVPLADDHTG